MSMRMLCAAWKEEKQWMLTYIWNSIKSYQLYNMNAYYLAPGPTAVSWFWAAFNDIDGSFGGRV